MPVIGFLDAASRQNRSTYRGRIPPGPCETGYIEGRNVAIEYRWAEVDYDRLPEMATDLVSRKVERDRHARAAAGALAAKAPPRRFQSYLPVGHDPVELGLVASLARPGGNVTGVNLLTSEWRPSGSDLLHELVPMPLVSPCSSIRPMPYSEPDRQRCAGGSDCRRAANPSSLRERPREIDAAFATARAEASRALLVGTDPFFNARRVQLVGAGSTTGYPRLIRCAHMPKPAD